MKIKLGTKSILILLLGFIISFALFSGNKLNLSYNSYSNNNNNFNVKASSMDFTNATVISDGPQGIFWNNDQSRVPDIAIDSSGNLHVVWSDYTDGIWGTDSEIMYASYSASTGWSMPTVISDGYNNNYWNTGVSQSPEIAIDKNDNLHVVWQDWTFGIWGTDTEIMYASYSANTGWSNITVISDGYNNNYWNTGGSFSPAITIDNSDNLHVVWYDGSDGVWGTDYEIMYVNYSEVSGWSNATVISDGYNSIYWNDGSSWYPEITSDNNGNIHVVWEDSSNGIWGTDGEIMYVSYTEVSGWSNATIISDGHNSIYWNDENSGSPDIAIDNSNNIHVVWSDNTDGAWGSDSEIMYTIYKSDWSLPIVISDGYNDSYWNNGHSDAPSITVYSNNIIYVAWADSSIGVWGADQEILCANYTATAGWSNITMISDGYNNNYWNDGNSRYPKITSDYSAKIHVVWEDDTDGLWGSDSEIMYTSISIPSVAGGNGISFGNFHLMFMFIVILGLVIYLKKKSKF